jgi:hypothetical protein
MSTTYYLGHIDGKILFATAIPDWNTHFTPPEGITAVEVSEGEYSSVVPDLVMAPYYIDANVVVGRPDLATVANTTISSGNVWLANGSSTISYGSGLPNPTTYTFLKWPASVSMTANVQTGNVTSGTFGLTSSVVGNYQIQLKAFPYLDKTLTWSAT